MTWTTVAVSDGGDRALEIDFSSAVTPGGMHDEPGRLVKARIVIRSTGEVREQTIWEPNYLARRRTTLERRLTVRPEDELTPQRIVG